MVALPCSIVNQPASALFEPNPTRSTSGTASLNLILGSFDRKTVESMPGLLGIEVEHRLEYRRAMLSATMNIKLPSLRPRLSWPFLREFRCLWL